MGDFDVRQLVIYDEDTVSGQCESWKQVLLPRVLYSHVMVNIWILFEKMWDHPTEYLFTSLHLCYIS